MFFNVLSIKQFFTVIQAPLSYSLVEGCLKIEQQKVYFPKDYPKLQLSTLVQRLEYTFFFSKGVSVLQIMTSSERFIICLENY